MKNLSEDAKKSAEFQRFEQAMKKILVSGSESLKPIERPNLTLSVSPKKDDDKQREK